MGFYCFVFLSVILFVFVNVLFLVIIFFEEFLDRLFIQKGDGFLINIFFCVFLGELLDIFKEVTDIRGKGRIDFLLSKCIPVVTTEPWVIKELLDT